tara:strand:+ start:124 stop:627 length:504 start_codon:yes stop_codon:yes gene_type:complete
VIQSDIPSFIFSYYEGLGTGSRPRPLSEEINEVILDIEKCEINIFTRRGSTRIGELIGRKGRFIKDLQNQIKEKFDDKWSIKIENPHSWYCPKCDLTFSSKSETKKHILEMGYTEEFNDNDLSLDRKILGVCEALLENGQVCSRTRSTYYSEFCGKCYRAKKKESRI